MHAIGRRTEAGIALESADENFQLYLLNANLQCGLLEELDLSYAFLESSNLSGTFLGFSDLSGASFDYSDLSGAFFEHTNLSNASFRGAYLYDARFFDSNLTGTNLEDADLTGALFNGRDIDGNYRYPATGLTQAQLDKARSAPDNPPRLEGVLDAETGEQLVWRGKLLDDDSVDPDE